VACVSHARNRGIFADRIKNVGKRPLVASGKYPVNEIDEEIGKPCEGGTVVARFVIAGLTRPTTTSLSRGRKNENARDKPGHNVVVSVDSERFDYAWLATALPSAACAAARRAIGTR
jgi:hypothetical protein